MQYEDIADQLAGIADGSIEPDAATRTFIDSDLQAQAELARYRRMLRELESMRGVHHEPPAGLLTQTLASVYSTRQDPNARRILYAGAIGGAVITAGAIAFVFYNRNRRVSA